MPIKIAIYEDNERLRQSLGLLIGAAPDMLLCGNYPNCLHIAEEVKYTQPDVVIMDIDMPGISGTEGVRICKETRPETQIIMYTVFEDDERIFESLCAGADGYVLKKSGPQQLLDAIRNVFAGGAPMTPSIARKVIGHFHAKKNAEENFHLSARELEILNYLVQGLSYKQIAAECHISLDTVRKHLQNIYHKLHVNCGTEAVAKALRYKIV
ncbi:MAG: response regulator transcription factor [Saprospiraceae bacterium]